jgi:hypothetical protein
MTDDADQPEKADLQETEIENAGNLVALHLPVEITSVTIEDHRPERGSGPIRLLPHGAELRTD